MDDYYIYYIIDITFIEDYQCTYTLQISFTHIITYINIV
jgi:hypothetical protein